MKQSSNESDNADRFSKLRLNFDKLDLRSNLRSNFGFILNKSGNLGLNRTYISQVVGV